MNFLSKLASSLLLIGTHGKLRQAPAKEFKSECLHFFRFGIVIIERQRSSNAYTCGPKWPI